MQGVAQTFLLLDTTFSVPVSGDNESVYIYNYTPQEYKAALIDNLWKTFREKNIKMEFSVDENTAPFYLNIAQFTISETIYTETVKDTASEQYGQSYDLSTCKIKIEYVLGTPEHQTIGSWKIVSVRQETLSNNRSFFEWLFGLNKDNTEYHKKILEKDIFLQEIQTVTKRLTKKIAKKIKKSCKKKP